jgi:hypothetical protein
MDKKTMLWVRRRVKKVEDQILTVKNEILQISHSLQDPTCKGETGGLVYYLARSEYGLKETQKNMEEAKAMLTRMIEAKAILERKEAKKNGR